MSDTLLEGLKRSSLLAGMPAGLVEAVARASEPIDLGGGEILFRQGDPADSLYFVLSGRLRVERTQCRLVRLTREAFERILAAHPQLLGPFVVLLARRLGTSRPGELRKAASCLTLLRGGDGVDIGAVAARLGEMLPVRRRHLRLRT